MIPLPPVCLRLRGATAATQATAGITVPDLGICGGGQQIEELGAAEWPLESILSPFAWG